MGKGAPLAAVGLARLLGPQFRFRLLLFLSQKLGREGSVGPAPVGTVRVLISTAVGQVRIVCAVLLATAPWAIGRFGGPGLSVPVVSG